MGRTQKRECLGRLATESVQTSLAGPTVPGATRAEQANRYPNSLLTIWSYSRTTENPP